MCKKWLSLVPCLVAGMVFGQPSVTSSQSEPRLLTTAGQVEVKAVGSDKWVAAKPEQALKFGDRVRTGLRSRAMVRLTAQTVMPVNELTTFLVAPPREAGRGAVLDVEKGSVYFYSRQRPAEQEIRTPQTSGAIRGTEFNLTVGEDGRTELALLDGQVTLSNALGQATVNTGDKGVVEPGKAPVRTAMVEAQNNIIQWCLYYPGVLDVNELELSTAEKQAIGASLEAYQSGDLLRAVALYPADRVPASASEQVYRAATLLSVGRVDQAEALLEQVQGPKSKVQSPESTVSRLAAALEQVIAVVKNQGGERAGSRRLATEWLAESYYAQSRGMLRAALQAAQSAVDKDPQFAFGWARVAELELSFGRLAAANEALEKSLLLAPRNAQSHALKGFLLLAKDKPAPAQVAFDEAIAIDGGLANGWLGRGLCKVRDGHADAGRQDLQVAAAAEPQRAVLRSYLAKGFGNEGDDARAHRELSLAERLDPNDPTAWLYAALVEQRENDVNKAIRDLEKSKELNDNRRLFRSRQLLDQDQAVRSASLAHIYQDAGELVWNKDVPISDWAVREASRAVNYDYANYSAHQFLASSYDALRDPRQINLRYESPWFSELIMANLLTPVGAANLSDFAAERPYSRLFEQNHFGFSSDTEYLSHGDWFERASQYGTYENVSYAADVEYRSENGWRPNNELEQTTATLKGKVQITPQDSLLLEGIYYDSTFGDETQYYDQKKASPTFNGSEREQPNVFLGYHHEWAPGVHTLFLGGHLDDHLRYSTGSAGTQIPFTTSSGNLILYPAEVDLNRRFHAYTLELQQIVQNEWHTFVAGGRYQYGWEDTTSSVTNGIGQGLFSANLDTTLERFSVYGYETLKLPYHIEVTGGVSYDRLHYPLNVDTSPITDAEANKDQVSPKAGIIWSPLPRTHLRGVYTRSLGGVFYDTSVRLEPSQVAGFNQTFRSIAPEAVAGLVPGSEFTTYGVGLDQSFDTGTYISLSAERLDSEATKTWGAFTNVNTGIIPIPNTPTSTRQSIDYNEKTFTVSLSQLICDQWSVGARYQLSYAALDSRYLDVPTDNRSQDQDARLNQLSMYLNYYHPCGFFAQLNSIWMYQYSHGYSPALESEDFWQWNIWGGYRFLRRAAEVKLGLLNITDRNYRLNPLNLYYDLPRARTLAVSVKLYF
ncbi:MAG: hypothetical protein C5B50_09485 [Verrucomicrobia bacterium]|nr:MAG: hypothetical protein C5B50_09485 [Verrucomicrobiota bacterium]